MEMGHDERELDAMTVRTNLVFFWLKTNLILTNRRVAGAVPNTVLLLFPVGRKDTTQPLNRISNVSFESKFKVIQAFGALLFLAFAVTNGAGTAGDIVTVVLYLIIAAVLAAWSWVATINLSDSSGQGQKIPVSVLDKAEVERFTGVVNRALADTDIADPRPTAAPEPPSVVPDRIEQLQRLTDLKNQGALTDDEFETEKRRLLE